MPRNSERNRSNGSRSSSNDWGVTEMVRERPIAAAAAAAGAAAAGLFLWSRRAQISNQLSNLSDQIGDWTENMGSSEGQFDTGDGTAGLTTTGSSTRSTTGTGRTSSAGRGMSETGGGNASLGRRSGGGGTRTAASGRGRVQSAPTT